MRYERSNSGLDADTTETVRDTESQGSDDIRVGAVASVIGELSLQPRHTLDIQLRPGHTRLGQKRVPFSLPRESRDYSDYRYRFLKALTDRQSDAGEAHPTMKPTEIWQAMGEEGRFEADVMIGIKRWLPKLSYHKQPLIAWNGKRGRGASYGVNQRFFLDVDDRIAKKIMPMIELPAAAEIYESVRHLSQFDFVLREYGVLEIEPGLEMALQDYKPDYSEIKNDGQSVQEYRAKALAKLDLLLSDQSYLSRYKEASDKSSPEYGLLRYIYDLTPNERYLLQRLTKANVEPSTVGGELRLEAIDQYGMLIAFLSPRSTEKTVEFQPPAEKPAPADVIYDRRAENDNSVEGEVSLRTERIEAMLDIIEAVANDTAATFLVNFRADKSYRLAQIQSAFPKFTTNKLVSAKTNNVITSVKNQPLSLEDVIRVVIHSDVYLRNLFTTRKYRDQVDSIIKKVIAENTERVENELIGEDDEF